MPQLLIRIVALLLLPGLLADLVRALPLSSSSVSYAKPFYAAMQEQFGGEALSPSSGGMLGPLMKAVKLWWTNSDESPFILTSDRIYRSSIKERAGSHEERKRTAGTSLSWALERASMVLRVETRREIEKDSLHGPLVGRGYRRTDAVNPKGADHHSESTKTWRGMAAAFERLYYGLFDKTPS
jgi:hypothetical protein